MENLDNYLAEKINLNNVGSGKVTVSILQSKRGSCVASNLVDTEVGNCPQSYSARKSLAWSSIVDTKLTVAILQSKKVMKYSLKILDEMINTSVIRRMSGMLFKTVISQSLSVPCHTGNMELYRNPYRDAKMKAKATRQVAAI